ncbi:serine/arginine-rich splicing factor 7-like isoform X3 [Silurus meridionalis]|uniref:serine/arginine-rich splicing factor 7-like isoform X3 n=1 Tax=Silurus meridionalis TaxID=175797 RepID=UPI001EEC9197|nr:serine/arginine-rich splicing factor 7-like isoform X3 [Silurus meridionalis]
MSRYGRHGGETKVYVGNLGTGAGKGELERAFGYYGPLRTVWIARNPPGFAFVEFDDPRDAEDAVRSLDGKVICGTRVRVELSTGMPRRSRYDRPPTRRPFDPNDRCYECGEKGHYAYDCHRYSRRRRSRFHRLIQSVTTLYDFMNLLANATLTVTCFDQGVTSQTLSKSPATSTCSKSFHLGTHKCVCMHVCPTPPPPNSKPD